MKNRSRFLLPGLALALAGATLSPRAIEAQNQNQNRPARPTTPAATTPATPATPTVVATPGTLVIGVVDEEQLADGYKKYQDSLASLDKRAGELDSKMPAREFMTTEEGTEFDALIVKPTPTAQEKARVDTLVTTGLAKRTEFMTLVGKAVRSEEEAARMKTLQDTMAGNQAQVRGITEKLLNGIRQEQDVLDKQFADNANTVVGQLAAEKKLAVILRKRSLVWWANTVDITNEVLQRLNQTQNANGS